MKQNGISDLVLEKYNLGELSSKEAAKIKILLKEDAVLNKRLEALKESNAQILDKYKPSDMAENIKHRLKMEETYSAVNRRSQNSSVPKERNFKRYGIFLPVLSGAALAVVIIPILMINFYKENTGNEIRFKGPASLLIYRKTTSGEEPLKDGDIARKGDVLQLAYKAGNKKHGVIYSIDGKGNLTWHFPAKLQEETELEPGKRILLPESYELDNAPAFERFFFITSVSRLDLRNIIKTASILAKTPGQSIEKSLELFKNENIIIITIKKGE